MLHTVSITVAGETRTFQVKGSTVAAIGALPMAEIREAVFQAKPGLTREFSFRLAQAIQNLRQGLVERMAQHRRHVVALSRVRVQLVAQDRTADVLDLDDTVDELEDQIHALSLQLA